jgi:putative polyketide hydroxylase
MEALSDVPVLIVGAGPAGLTAAATLAEAGVSSLLVERRSATAALPRATTFTTRSMELLRAWGLEDALRAGGNEVEWVLWRSETLARAAEGEGFAIGLPTREQSALVSPTGPACAPQDHLERIMLEHLRASEHVDVATGTELVRIDVRREGSAATLRDVRTGAERVVHARYVVAADGGRSRIRAAAGIAMEGPERLMDGVSAVFRAPLWDLVGEHRYGIYGVARPEPDGAAFLPAGPGDRWGYGFMWPAASGEAPSAQRLEAMISESAGVPGLPIAMERVGAFSAGVQLAERYRHESAFLVGDAAHRVTPRGGTGMNTAIHDGHDLGWKLGWVLQGWAGDELLDTYEAERRPVAAHNAARSADPDGSVRDVDAELRVDLGGRLPHAWIERGVSTVDVLGPGLTMFTGPGGPAGAEGPVPVTVRRVDELSARALGILPGGSLLVRPDGTPAERVEARAAA